MRSLYLIIILCLAYPLKAQLIRSIGPHLAFTRSNIETDFEVMETSYRSGFNSGFFIEWLNMPVLSVNTELNYVQKGFTEEIQETDEIGTLLRTVKATSKVDYISIPFMVRLRYRVRKTEPFISIGPRVDFLIGKKAGIFKFTQAAYESEFIKDFDDVIYGGSFSAGAVVPDVLPFPVKVEFRYNIDYSDSLPENDFIEMRNKTFDVWLGLLL